MKISADSLQQITHVVIMVVTGVIMSNPESREIPSLRSFTSSMQVGLLHKLPRKNGTPQKNEVPSSNLTSTWKISLVQCNTLEKIAGFPLGSEIIDGCPKNVFFPPAEAKQENPPLTIFPHPTSFQRTGISPFLLRCHDLTVFFLWPRFAGFVFKMHSQAANRIRS